MKSKKVILAVISGIILCTALVLFSSCNNGVATNQPTNDNHIHDYNKQVVAPTCTEKGYTVYTCNGCNDEYIDNYTSPFGHKYKDEVISATCEERGYTKHTCVICNDYYEDAFVESLGHNYVNGVCIRCGEKVDKEATSDEYFTFRLLDDGTYGITAKDKNNMPADVVLPSTHEGNPVTFIGIRAFWDCSSLTSIEIPSSVTSIGDGEFYECYSLTSITVDENNQNYKSIDGNLYSKDGKTLIQYAIGKTATSFAIPDGVTSIGSSAFSSCSSLTSIEIPSSVTSIGYYAFKSCSKLTSVTFGENSRLTSIGYDAFSGCSSLTSVKIPSSVTSIGDLAFYNCSSLTSITVDVNNKKYKSIDGNLYSKNGKTLIQYAIGKTATSFSIPGSVISIGNYAFAWCSSLTSIEIPSSVTSISSRAFYNCSSLTSVTFKNTSGWNVSTYSDMINSMLLSSGNLSDVSTAATYLTSTYRDYYWERK